MARRISRLEKLIYLEKVRLKREYMGESGGTGGQRTISNEHKETIVKVAVVAFTAGALVGSFCGHLRKDAAPQKPATTISQPARTSITTPQSQIPKNEFNKVFRLGMDDKYAGDADLVMLVFNEVQIAPAELYRRDHFADKRVDAAICENPMVQKHQLGDRGFIYHDVNWGK